MNDNTPSLKHIVEAAIFAAGDPMSVDRLQTLFPEGEEPAREDIEAALREIANDYATRPLTLQEVSSGFRFQVREEAAPWVSRLWEEKPARYTRALLETLALIAYRQPITRGEIEDIRGVSVNTQILKTLQDREWIRVVGHRDVPGRPALLATTRQFLDYFNLKSLEDLPPLSALKDLDQAAEGLNFDDIADAVRAELKGGDGDAPGIPAVVTAEKAAANDETLVELVASNDVAESTPALADDVRAEDAPVADVSLMQALADAEEIDAMAALSAANGDNEASQETETQRATETERSA